ncbi:hypothetical protein F4680DRAFT_419724 [Xylaria scruposa]|nr:hypothetical protein F4680DRAFT_419724 [Xylaria scruposa]
MMAAELRAWTHTEALDLRTSDDSYTLERISNIRWGVIKMPPDWYIEYAGDGLVEYLGSGVEEDWVSTPGNFHYRTILDVMPYRAFFYPFNRC